MEEHSNQDFPYILAKDECAGMSYAGPEWAPFNLWSQYSFGASGPNPERTKECAKVLIYYPNASELWSLISERYPKTRNALALTLPVRCAEFLDTWHAIQKRPPAEHRDHQLRLKDHAEQIARELDHFFDRWDYDDYGPINFTQLMTEDELDSFGGRVPPSQRPLVWEILLGDGKALPPFVPDLPDMMRRIANLFAEGADLPPLQRPNFPNAQRNYFVRRAIRFFLHEHGSCSPSIVAHITSMFFPQGISENEVSKQVDRLPDGRLMPHMRG